MSAQLKKVIADTDAVHLKYSLPNRGNSFFVNIPRGHEALLQFSIRSFWFRQSLPADSATSRHFVVRQHSGGPRGAAAVLDSKLLVSAEPAGRLCHLGSTARLPS